MITCFTLRPRRALTCDADALYLGDGQAEYVRLDATVALLRTRAEALSCNRKEEKAAGGRGGGPRRARSAVLRAHHAVLVRPAQAVSTHTAARRRPPGAATKTRLAVGDEGLEARSSCIVRETAGGGLVAAGLRTAERGGIRHRGQNAATEDQHQNASEHLPSRHGPTSCVC